jgi:hypothetical protein
MEELQRTTARKSEVENKMASQVYRYTYLLLFLKNKTSNLNE